MQRNAFTVPFLFCYVCGARRKSTKKSEIIVQCTLQGHCHGEQIILLKRYQHTSVLPWSKLAHRFTKKCSCLLNV